MAKEYNWRATTTFQSDTTLSHGAIPSTWENWQTAGEGAQAPGQITYYYRDANVAGPGGFTDANSSRVAIVLTESWTASIDNNNNLTITLTTTLDEIRRDDLQGSNQNTPGRNINLYREQGGAAILSLADNQLAVAHTIYSGPTTITQETFTLPPGQSASRNSLYIHNQTVGSTSYDDIWAGIQFMNPLPADYRPGQRKLSGTWYSHNRNGGVCSRKVGSWTELRTLDGGSGTGNPPSRKASGVWYNQRKVGQE